MDKNKIFLKTKNVARGNIVPMFVVALILIAVFVAFFIGISILLPSSSFLNPIETYLSTPKSILDDTSYFEFAFGKPLSYGLIKTILGNILILMAFMAFLMAQMDFIKDFESESNNKFSIKLFFINLKTYGKELFLVSFVFAIFSVITILIPYVGIFIEIFLKILLFFVPFIIKENKVSNPFTLIKEAYKLTKGYKYDLFKIMMKYTYPLFILIIIAFLLSFINFPEKLVALISLFFLVRAFLYINMAIILAYQDILSFEDFKKNFARN